MKRQFSDCISIEVDVSQSMGCFSLVLQRVGFAEQIGKAPKMGKGALLSMLEQKQILSCY